VIAANPFARTCHDGAPARALVRRQESRATSDHSNVHVPMLPRVEYEGSANGGAVADCIQMVEEDLKVLLDKLDKLGLREGTIVIFAGDNGPIARSLSQATVTPRAPGVADIFRPTRVTIERQV
jgi:arylsulfatase A-like enzyme